MGSEAQLALDVEAGDEGRGRQRGEPGAGAEGDVTGDEAVEGAVEGADVGRGRGPSSRHRRRCGRDGGVRRRRRQRGRSEREQEGDGDEHRDERYAGHPGCGRVDDDNVCYRSPMRRAATSSAPIVLSVVCSLGLSSCLTLRAVFSPRHAHVVAADVAYVAAGESGSDGRAAVDDKQRLDVWAPDGAHDAPVVIFVHGGYWNSGDRRYFDAVTGLYGNVGRALGGEGIVTVVPSYRLFPRVPSVEPMLDDLAAVVRWTHEHIASYGGSPEDIVLAGHSAGGHLVLQLVTAPHALEQRGVDPRLVKGVAPISGVFDVARSTRLSDDEMRAALWLPLFGAHPDAWSPLRQLSPDLARATPMLFLVGGDDEKDCLLDYDDAHAALAEVEGTAASFRRIDGNSHRDMVLEIDTAADEVTPALAAFVHRVTATATTAPPPTAPPTP